MAENIKEIETISKSEEIDKKLSEKEEKLGVLVSPFDYYSYKKEGNDFYAVVDGKTLNIPFSNGEDLANTIKLIQKLMSTNNEITLTGDVHGRYLEEEISIIDKIKNIYNNGDVGNILFETNGVKENKNKAEEIFKFVMTLKGVDQDDWNIEGEVCKLEKEECIADLGFPNKEETRYANK